MKEQIKEHISEPETLERLYQSDKNGFKTAFEEIYPEIENTGFSKFWRARLDYKKVSEMPKIPLKADIAVMLAACLFAGILIKIPYIFGAIQEEPFYLRNAGTIVFAGLTLYSVLANKVSGYKGLLFVLGAFLIPAIYINLLPWGGESDVINLICIHLPLLMWSVYGLVYMGLDPRDNSKRMEYLGYNGELAIMMAIIAIAGGILTAITVGLFSAIGINIEEFYMENVVFIGAVSVPIVASFTIKYLNVVTNKIAPMIANIFGPIVLLTAIAFLVALLFTGKDLYGDRDFLLMFNVMLLGVMAVIVFSVTGISAAKKQRFNEAVLFALSIVTTVIDLIALSAIFYRLGAFGLTPNRLAVLGSNILILGNLLWITYGLFRVNYRRAPISEVELSISKYLPVYLVWIVVVVFGFPLVFGLN